MRVRLLVNHGCWSAAMLAAAGLSFAGCGGGDTAPPAVSIHQDGANETSTPTPSGDAAPAQAPVSQVAATGSNSGGANPAAAPMNTAPPMNAPAGTMPAPGGQAAAGGQMNVSTTATAGAPAGQNAEGQPVLPPPMTAAELAAEIDLENVPNGTPAELLQYMNDLTAVPFPNNANPQELRQFAMKVYTNVLTAGDKVLAVPGATSEERRAAVQFKFNAYEMLTQILPDQAEVIRQERVEFAKSIVQDKDPNVSRFARLFLFETMLSQFASGEKSLEQYVMEDVGYIIQDPNADIMHFGVAENAAIVFARMGHTEKAVSILNQMKTSFTGTQDEQLAARTAELDDMILQYKIVGTMIGAANGDESKEDVLVQNIRNWVATKNPKEDLEPLQLMSTIEMQMEDHSKMNLARRIAALMQETYGDHPDPQVVESVKVSVANAQKRTNLIAKPFVVEGNTLNGVPFDWNQYRGKYVLVDFWASWCPICIEEMEGIKQVYQKYRSRGFEVVGVNLDQDPRARAQFFQANSLPWPTVVSANPDVVGFSDPNAVRCGVEALPFMVFVGPDGTVVEINPRGERLEELLLSVLDQGSGGVQTLSNPGITQMPQNNVPGANLVSPNAQPAAGTANAGSSLKVVR